jgi:hypothetical protein
MVTADQVIEDVSTSFIQKFFEDDEEKNKLAIRLGVEEAESVFDGTIRLFVHEDNLVKSIEIERPYYVMVGEKIVGAMKLAHGFEIDQEDFSIMKSLHCSDVWNPGMYGHRILDVGMFDSSINVYLSQEDADKKILEVEKKSSIVTADIWKSITEERIIAAAVLVPGRTDLHEEIYDEDTVRAAAYYFMEHYLQDDEHGIDVMHDNEVVPDAIRVLQSFVLDEDKTYSVEVSALDIDHEAREKSEISFPKGTWIMYARVISDTLWEKVKRGELKSWSIAGLARVRELRKMLMAA